MRPIIGNKFASLQCVGLFTRNYKTKHNTDGPLLLRDRKKLSIRILFQEVCLGWKHFPIIDMQGVDIRMSWVGKIEKLISGWAVY